MYLWYMHATCACARAWVAEAEAGAVPLGMGGGRPREGALGTVLWCPPPSSRQGIDDVCMKYLVEAGVIGVRRCKKEDLRRIAAATGGTLLPNLADLEGGETFDAAHLGRAEEVSEEKVGDGE